MLSHILKPQREPVTGPYNPSSLDTDLPHILTVMFTQMITACISHREIREERQHQRLSPTRWRMHIETHRETQSSALHSHDAHNGRCLVPTFRPHNIVLRLRGNSISKSILRFRAATPSPLRMIARSTHRNNANYPRRPPQERRGLKRHLP